MKSYKRLLWALRKVRLPVDDSAIVLDVGSGGNPHPRADVLLDRLSGAEHRGGDPMLIDRPAIIGDATKLPFKDKSFDYVIASHILEHMPNPEIFLSELQRVSKAGYIETPNYMCERLIPCRAHCLEIAISNNILQIHKKKSYTIDHFMAGLDFPRSDKNWGPLYFSNPALFHVRYFWRDAINYKIHNPETSCEWIQDVYRNSQSENKVVGLLKRKNTWRSMGSAVYESIQRVKRKSRLKNFALHDVLVCPECKGCLLSIKKILHCPICNASYSIAPHINFEKIISQE